MSGLEAFLFGALGGLLAEFLAVSRHRRENIADWPKYFRTLSWVFGLLWVGLGGLVAWLYNGEPNIELSRLLALNIGGTAPLIVEQLFRAVPKVDPGKAG